MEKKKDKDIIRGDYWLQLFPSKKQAQNSINEAIGHGIDEGMKLTGLQGEVAAQASNVLKKSIFQKLIGTRGTDDNKKSESTQTNEGTRAEVKLRSGNIIYNHGIGMKNAYDFDRKNFNHKLEVGKMDKPGIAGSIYKPLKQGYVKADLSVGLNMPPSVHVEAARTSLLGPGLAKARANADIEKGKPRLALGLEYSKKEENKEMKAAIEVSRSPKGKMGAEGRIEVIKRF